MGDIAAFTGKSWMMSCCLAYLCAPCMPCLILSDRAAMVATYKIQEPMMPNGFSFCSQLMIYACCCGSCLVCQEYNTMKKLQSEGKSHGNPTGGGNVVVIQQMAPAPQY